MNFKLWLFSLFILIASASCSGSKNELEQLISRSLRDNSGLADDECQAIRALISTDQRLLKEFGQDKALEQLIDDIAKKLSKRRSTPIEYPLKHNCFSISKPEITSFNVYLENSASMDGYYNGLTEYKDALFFMLAQINGKDEPVQINFINQQIYPIEKALDEFIAYLNPKSLSGLGSRGNTKINDILKQVVDQYKKDNKPAILISDYIYSLSNATNVQSQLPTIKYTMATTCQELDKDNDAILVIKNQSKFNGIYYDIYNTKTNLNGQFRPYYIWIIGNKNAIYSFMDKYSIKQAKGYQDFLIIDHSNSVDIPENKLLAHTLKNGRFSICRDQQESLCIENIEFNDRESPASLQFALALDLSKIPLSEKLKLEPSNFVITSQKGDQLQVIMIQSISSIEKNDERFRGNATHIIAIRTQALSRGEQVINIKMKKGIPPWVKEVSTNDDSQDAIKNKTFGLDYLIEGVNLAFNPTEAFYFDIPLTIRYD
jgi:hypothetical protein